MQYSTGVPFTGAIPANTRQEGLAGLAAPSPYKFPGSHQDVYAAMAKTNATDFDRTAQSADIEMMTKSRDLQSQMALRGLEQMAQGQDMSRNVSNQIYGNQTGFLNGLLSGLYR